jgi:hypothetical protein
MEKDAARSVVDVHLRHPGALHHHVERHEVFLDEVDQVHRVVFHGGLGFAEALEAAEVWQQAERHHGERLGVEVAEEKPVGPDAVEALVELPHLGDQVEFLRVVVPDPCRRRGR